MKVAMYRNNRDVRLEEAEKPQLADGEILLRVMASGICGSDVMEWYRIKKAPLVLGHEVSGVVEESKTQGFSRGERVVATHHVPCLSCGYCKSGRETACETLRRTGFEPGGFSEFLKIPKINIDKGGVLKLPKNLSYEEGTFVEPLACAVRAQRLAGGCEGKNVLILGSGISGLLHLQLAKASGASKVLATDISDHKLDFAESLGAYEALNAKEDVPAKVKEILGRKADLVIVCAGAAQAVRQALQSVDDAGTVLLFAPTGPDVEVPLNLCDLWSRQVRIITSYAASPGDLEEALNLIKEGRINVREMVTHRFPLDKAGEAFAAMAEGKSLKVIIEPNRN